MKEQCEKKYPNNDEKQEKCYQRKLWWDGLKYEMREAAPF